MSIGGTELGKVWTAGLTVIGDEILSGRTQDKNIGQVATWLNAQGIRLAEVRVVPDMTERIVEAVTRRPLDAPVAGRSSSLGKIHSAPDARSLQRLDEDGYRRNNNRPAVFESQKVAAEAIRDLLDALAKRSSHREGAAGTHSS